MVTLFRKYSIGCVAFASLVASTFIIPVQAAEWYFYVKNDSSSAITRLEVKEAGGSWLKFNLNGAISVGKKVRIDWAASTNSDDCKQFVRATFADGSVSSSTMFDFCRDLDTPIVFND
jgi:hypothetical protein